MNRRKNTNIHRPFPKFRVVWLSTCCWLLATVVGALPPQEPPPADSATTEITQQVELEPVADDEVIAKRLTRILEATTWFDRPQVTVDEGVVFLSGLVDEPQHKEWASRLTTNTEGVVAVVNHIEIREKSMWDLSPAWNELQDLGAQAVRNSPLVLVGLVLLLLTWWASKWAVRASRTVFRSRFKSPLLRDVAARAVAVPVFLLGLYLVLKTSGLTRLAVTVLGGTGLLGLVIGFAFRDIAENFLASILISMQRPFAAGDLIEVAGYKGFVQTVNTRSTLLMTMEGNHVQIPNATIYKDTITNHTANPFTRVDFLIGIGYDDVIADAQSVALSVLREHPAVVNEPEPLVLVESLGASTINLRVYLWVNTGRYSGPKVRSAVIRQTTHALIEAGISLPDEAREVIFPNGVPVRMVSDDQPARATTGPEPVRSAARESSAHSAEGDLASEAEEIQEQARNARLPEEGQNLLE